MPASAGETLIATCQPCDHGTIQWMANQTACVPCPPEGVDCDSQAEINVRPGFYLPASNGSFATQQNGSAWPMAVLAKPLPCPMRQACKGGSVAGDSSCREGYKGPLCGVCKRPQFFRNTYSCERCPDWSAKEGLARARVEVLLLVTGALVVAAAIFRVFYTALQEDVRSCSACCIPLVASVAHRSWVCRVLAAVWPRVLHAGVTLSTLAKITIGYAQVTAAFQSFQNVRWPPIFSAMLQKLEAPFNMLADFELVPVDCLVRYTVGSKKTDPSPQSHPSTPPDNDGPAPLAQIGRAFGFYERLVGVLLTPVIASACMVLVAALAVVVNKRWCEARTLRTLLLSPTSFSLHMWMLLLLYPMLSRAVLSTLTCVQVRGYWFLRADQDERCDTPRWRTWVAVSVVFLILYCVGIPAAMWVASSRAQPPHGRAQWWHPRVVLLRTSYSDRFWWFESVDMLRKFVLASVVMHIAPGTKGQLWFGMVIASTAALSYLKLAPYRSTLCQSVQMMVQLQVLFTYSAATVFYQEPGAPMWATGGSEVSTSDWVLVLTNCSCFTLLVVMLLRDWAGSRARLLQTSSGSVNLPAMPKNEFHLMLSHAWSHGQDQMRIVKQRLLEMLPDAKIFLDADDLTEGRGAEAVDASSSVLVFCSRSYFSSPNCARELLRAVVLHRPIILLFESDANRGGLACDEVHRELTALIKQSIGWGLHAEVQEWGQTMPTAAELHDALFKNEPIEWNRIGALQNVTMRLIAERLLSPAPGVEEKVFVQSELGKQRPKMYSRWRRGDDREVYCSQNNAGALELLQEVDDALQAAIQWTSIKSDMQACSTMLVVLDSRTWTSGATSQAFANELRQAMAAGLQLTLVHEMPGLTDSSERHAMEFSAFYEHASGTTPRDLIRNGLYHSIAVPLKGGSYRRTGLVMIVHALGGRNERRWPALVCAVVQRCVCRLQRRFVPPLRRNSDAGGSPGLLKLEAAPTVDLDPASQVDGKA